MSNIERMIGRIKEMAASRVKVRCFADQSSSLCRFCSSAIIFPAFAQEGQEPQFPQPLEAFNVNTVYMLLLCIWWNDRCRSFTVSPFLSHFLQAADTIHHIWPFPITSGVCNWVRAMNGFEGRLKVCIVIPIQFITSLTAGFLSHCWMQLFPSLRRRTALCTN